MNGGAADAARSREMEATRGGAATDDDDDDDDGHTKGRGRASFCGAAAGHAEEEEDDDRPAAGHAEEEEEEDDRPAAGHAEEEDDDRAAAGHAEEEDDAEDRERASRFGSESRSEGGAAAAAEAARCAAARMAASCCSSASSTPGVFSLLICRMYCSSSSRLRTSASLPPTRSSSPIRRLTTCWILRPFISQLQRSSGSGSARAAHVSRSATSGPSRLGAPRSSVKNLRDMRAPERTMSVHIAAEPATQACTSVIV